MQSQNPVRSVLSLIGSSRQPHADSCRSCLGDLVLSESGYFIRQFEMAHAPHLLQIGAVLGCSDEDIARRRVAIASGQAVPNQVPLISVDRSWSAARHASIVALRKPAVAAHTLN